MSLSQCEILHTFDLQTINVCLQIRNVQFILFPNALKCCNKEANIFYKKTDFFAKRFWSNSRECESIEIFPLQSDVINYTTESIRDGKTIGVR